MARLVFDFLLESFLFSSEKIATNYRGIPENELNAELENYRKHVLGFLNEINKDLVQNIDRIGAYFDTSSFRSVPPYSLLKRTALYFDRCIIEDPIFKLTSPKNENTKVFSQFLGLNPKAEIDRTRLSKAANFMKDCGPFVGGDFLSFAPISLLHETPAEIPLTYSENLYAEQVPPELLGWFHENAKIYPVEKVDGVGLVTKLDASLEPCRGICIEFPDHPHSRIYQLTQMRTKPTEDPNKYVFTQTLPDTPPNKKDFEIWVTQSVNQTAGSIFNHVASDMRIAGQTGSMFFTNSKFVSTLLSLHLKGAETINSDVANLAFKLDIPFLEDISTEDLMHIRKNDGEAFDDFRINLQRHLRSLRHESDIQVIAKRLEDVEHELMDVQVREIELKINRIKKRLYGNLGVGIASLATIIPTSGASVASLLLAGANTYKQGVKYIREIKEHPAYFLYRIKKEAKK